MLQTVFPPVSVPVDHTFFLANFCTTSIASSMSASFMPKRDGYRGYGEANNGVGSAGGKHNQPAVTTGASGNSTATTITSHNVDKTKATAGQQADKNYYGGGTNNGNSSSSSGGGGGGGLYNGGDLVGRTTAASAAASGGNKTGPASASTGQAGGQDSDLQKGGSVFASHELVAAISQITRRPNDTSPSKASGHSQQTGGKSDLWAKEETELVGDKQAASSSVSQGSYMGHNGYGAGTGGSNVQSSPGGLAADVQGQQQSGQQPHDASNESVTSESDDGRPSTGSAAPVSAATAAATAAAVAAYNSIEFDNKPLSFARIASLGLEKATGAPVPAPTMRMGSNAGNSQGTTGHMTALGKVGQQPQLTANMTPLPHPMSMASGVMDRPGGGSGGAGGAGLVNVAGLGNPGGGNSCPSASATMSLIPLPPSNNPRYFFDIAMEGKRLGRVIIEVQPSVAPKMSQNFGMLVNGDRGFGYKGCHFFQAWKNESVICGDWEHNSGRGGRAALDGGPLFTPDETRLPCIRGAVGMRRMSKKHSSLNQVSYCLNSVDCLVK